jgi:hypothetical protein
MAEQVSDQAEETTVAGNLSPNLPWMLANPRWAATLNTLLANPIVNGSILSGVVLASGANTVNHGLGRPLQGYIVILNNSAVTIHDSQSSNQMPQLTLILNASGATTVSLYVF